MSKNLRNALIVLAIAGAVYALPGGGTTADTVGAVLSILITVSIAFFGYRFYRENRIEIFSLGDQYRGILYGSLGVIVLTMSVRPRLTDTPGGKFLFLVLLLGALTGLVTVFRHYRSYQY